MIQLEWIFLQRVTKDTGCVFAVVEKLLQETFLNSLFFVNSKYLPPIVGTLSTMSFSKYVLGLQEPVISANDKYLSLLHARSELIGSVTGERLFSTSYHLLVLREERCDGKKTGIAPTRPNSRD